MIFLHCRSLCFLTDGSALGFNLSYWITTPNNTFTSVINRTYTSVVKKSIPYNVTGQTFWWNTTTSPLSSGSYRFYYAYDVNMCTDTCRKDLNGTITTSAFVPFYVASDGSRFDQGVGARDNVGFTLPISNAVYDCTVLGIIDQPPPPPNLTSSAFREKSGRLLLGVIIVGISLM